MTRMAEDQHLFKDLEVGKRDAPREPEAKVEWNRVEGIEVQAAEGTGCSPPSQVPSSHAISHSSSHTLLPDDELLLSHTRRSTGSLLIRVRGVVEEPLVIVHAYERGLDAYRTTRIVLEKGASCTVIERHEGDAAFASHVAEAIIEQNAQLRYASIETVHGTFFSRRSASCARDASVRWFELQAGTGRSSCRTRASLEGENAAANAVSVFLGSQEDIIDTGAEAHHACARTSCDLLTKGVLAGTAEGAYEGVVRIGADAAKSSAFQREECLLLGDAQMRASPLLFIENDDVACSHAASASRPDADRLFYLQARGLGRKEAERLLMTGFLWPAFEALDETTRALVLPIAEPLIERFAGRTRTSSRDSAQEAQAGSGDDA